MNISILPEELSVFIVPIVVPIVPPPILSLVLLVIERPVLPSTTLVVTSIHSSLTLTEGSHLLQFPETFILFDKNVDFVSELKSQSLDTRRFCSVHDKSLCWFIQRGLRGTS